LPQIEVIPGNGQRPRGAPQAGKGMQRAAESMPLPGISQRKLTAPSRLTTGVQVANREFRRRNWDDLRTHLALGQKDSPGSACDE